MAPGVPCPAGGQPYPRRVQAQPAAWRATASQCQSCSAQTLGRPASPVRARARKVQQSPPEAQREQLPGAEGEGCLLGRTGSCVPVLAPDGLSSEPGPGRPTPTLYCPLQACGGAWLLRGQEGGRAEVRQKASWKVSVPSDGQAVSSMEFLFNSFNDFLK